MFLERSGHHRLLLVVLVVLATRLVHAQASQNSYQGSVVQQKATNAVLPLSLDDAIRMGLKNNLGSILQNTDVRSSGGQKLQNLQALLPTVTGIAQSTRKCAY